MDASGNADATPAERPFAVDATVPSAPKIKSPANHSYDADGSFAIKGTAEAGSTVRLYEIVKLSDGTTKKVFKGAATARSSGSWGKTLSGVANGKHSYKATATDEAGNVSAASAARTITVDKIRPVVKSVSPVNKATGVPPTTNVSAAFSEAMKASTLNRLTFTLVRKGTTTKVAATVSYNPNTKKVMLNSTKSLMRGATYTAKITPGAKDLAGNGLEGNRVWSFRVRP